MRLLLKRCLVKEENRLFGLHGQNNTHYFTGHTGQEQGKEQAQMYTGVLYQSFKF